MSLRLARPLSWVAALAVAGAGLASAPAAHAAPVFDTAVLTTSSNAGTNESADNCTTNDLTTDNDVTQAIVENGPTINFTRNHSATWTNGDDPNDDGSSAASLTGSVRAASAGTSSWTVDFATQGTATMNPDLAATACSEPFVYAGAESEFNFNVPQAGWLALDVSNRGSALTQAYVERLDGSGSERDNSAFVMTFRSSEQVLLPPGDYRLLVDGEVGVNSQTDASVTGSSKVHASFALVGSQSAAPEGKGKRYVKFPASRNCGAHTLTPAITEKGKRAKKIQSVKFFVNDQKLKKVVDPSKGQAVALTLADDEDADVRAVVKLEKVKKGVPAKKREVTTSYLACT